MLGPFRDILSRSGIQLEHPTISELYDSLVLQGNFAHCEELLQVIAGSSLFTSSLLASQSFSRWTRLHGVDADGDTPSARGGHAMCIDSQGGKIYLFGGWDGQRNLDDLWLYDIKSDKWTVLSHSTLRQLYGPGPRACHKMVFDSDTGDIYIFGRLDDSRPATSENSEGSHSSGTAAPTVSPISPSTTRALPPTSGSSRSFPTPPWSPHPSQRHRYDTRGRDAGQWERVTHDTAVSHCSRRGLTSKISD